MILENFTDRARKVLALARQEAGRLHHSYVGTEHLLLGLAAEKSGRAAHILKDSGLGLDEAREQVRVTISGDPSRLPTVHERLAALESAVAGLSTPAQSPPDQPAELPPIDFAEPKPKKKRSKR